MIELLLHAERVEGREGRQRRQERLGQPLDDDARVLVDPHPVHAPREVVAVHGVAVEVRVEVSLRDAIQVDHVVEVEAVLGALDVERVRRVRGLEGGDGEDDADLGALAVAVCIDCVVRVHRVVHARVRLDERDDHRLQLGEAQRDRGRVRPVGGRQEVARQRDREGLVERRPEIDLGAELPRAEAGVLRDLAHGALAIDPPARRAVVEVHVAADGVVDPARQRVVVERDQRRDGAGAQRREQRVVVGDGGGARERAQIGVGRGRVGGRGEDAAPLDREAHRVAREVVREEIGVLLVQLPLTGAERGGVAREVGRGVAHRRRRGGEVPPVRAVVLALAGGQGRAAHVDLEARHRGAEEEGGGEGERGR